MDKDLSVEKHYQEFWKMRQDLIQRIYDEVNLNDPRLRTCHNTQVMNAKVLKSLKNDFMKQKGYDYKKLIEISPYEFTWYNAWFQKCELVKEVSVEPFVKMFHMRIEYIFSRLKMITKKDLEKAYLGIVLNSNWERPESEYQNPTWWMKKLYKKLEKSTHKNFNKKKYKLFKPFIKCICIFTPISSWRKKLRNTYK